MVSAAASGADLHAGPSRQPGSPPVRRLAPQLRDTAQHPQGRRPDRVTIHEASSFSDVRRWYRLYLITMRAHGIPPRPLRLFEVIWDILAPLGLARLLLAQRNCTGGQSRLLAGCLFLAHNGTVMYAFNGCDPTELEYRPNDAIHWQAITDACQAGRRRYDFGEDSGGNNGLVRFKEKCSAVHKSLPLPLPAATGSGTGSAFARSLPPGRRVGLAPATIASNRGSRRIDLRAPMNRARHFGVWVNCRPGKPAGWSVIPST